MPRNLVRCALLGALLVGCSIHADYAGGHYRCGDGVCPSGLSCQAGVCVAGDAASATDGLRGDAAIDASIDARAAGLTCADPGAAVGSVPGTTVGRTSTISSLCGGLVMNGPDAVYRVSASAGQTIHVSITGSYAVKAYVIAPCVIAPTTPACLGNVAAIAGVPLAVPAPTTGDYFVVVDDENPALSGTYDLTVTVG